MQVCSKSGAKSLGCNAIDVYKDNPHWNQCSYVMLCFNESMVGAKVVLLNRVLKRNIDKG